MIKAIVSSGLLLKALKQVKAKEEYLFVFLDKRKELEIDGLLIGCECSAYGYYKAKFSSVNKLRSILMLLEEQPITIAVDDSNWLYIKEAVL